MSEQSSAPVHKREVDVIVAGSGHNGLVGAAYLAKAGFETLVLEAHATPGGMTCTNPMAPEAPDHLINEASIHASMFHMSPIDQELELTATFGLRQRPIDPCHVQLSPDGPESLGLWRDPRKVADELSYWSKKDAANYIELCELFGVAMDIGLPMAMLNPTRIGIADKMGLLMRTAKHLGKLKKLKHLFSSTQAGIIEELFESEMGRAPWNTALPFMHFNSDMSAFALIYVGVLQRFGITMFEGGTGAFPAALIRCIEAHKGQVRCNAPVAEMIVRGGRVVGVRLQNGDEILARKAVMTAFSPANVLNRMLPKGTMSRQDEVTASKIPTASRGIADFKLNMALKGKLTLLRHQKWRNDKREGLDLRLPTTQWATHQQAIDAFDACVRGEIPQIIAGLAQITTAFDPAMAPPGHDTFWYWSGLVPFKPQVGWDVARETVTNQLVKECSQYFDGIESLEIARRPLAPPDIEKRFHAIDGSVYHVDPYLTRFGPNRPAPGFGGYKTPVPGLYLSASGTHPSAGICGLPGRNAAKTLIDDLK